jgi:hypothetical protein
MQEKHQNGDDSLRGDIKQLTERIGKIERYLALAVTIAIVFGIGGAWGFAIISSAKTEITQLENKVQDVKSQADGVKGTYTDLKDSVPELERQLSDLKFEAASIGKDREVAVAKMREETAREVVRLQDRFQVAGERNQQATQDLLQKKQQAAQDAITEGESEGLTVLQKKAETATGQLEETQAQIEKKISEVFSSTINKPVRKKCDWVKFSESQVQHQSGGDWCPEGKFLAQMEFDVLALKTVECCFLGFGP